jgi:hypothetical protein
LDWLLKVIRHRAAGILLLPCLWVPVMVAQALAARLEGLLGTPAAAGLLMLALLCALVALVQDWVSSERRDFET